MTVTSRTVVVEPVATSCGAEVSGIDLRHASTADLDVLNDALARHGVLFFRDQDLAAGDQLALTRKFGTLLRVPYVQPLDEFPDIIAVLKEADEQRISTFGGTWHSDFSFLPEPPSLTLLYALETPAVGGDTLWSSQAAAYEALSGGMQRLLDPLKAVHTGWPHGTSGPEPGASVSRSIRMVRNDPSADREVAHPIVRIHPVTGRKALFVNPVYTRRIEGMTDDESQPLLQYLFDHATKGRLHLQAAVGTGNVG